MATWNYAILVFKKRGNDARDSLDFKRSVGQIRKLAHDLGFEDGMIMDAFDALAKGNYEGRHDATEADEVEQ